MYDDKALTQTRKPMQEKERRSKINHYLEVLKKLVTCDGVFDATKLEQADILDKTVDLVCSLDTNDVFAKSCQQKGRMEGFDATANSAIAYLQMTLNIGPSGVFYFKAAADHMKFVRGTLKTTAEMSPSTSHHQHQLKNSSPESGRSTPSPGSSVDRRVKKQIMERERRNRMKESFDKLKAFLVNINFNEICRSKLEKIDILEGVIVYIEAKRRERTLPDSSHSYSEGFRNGYETAKTAICSFVMAAFPEVAMHLASHLESRDRLTDRSSPAYSLESSKSESDSSTLESPQTTKKIWRPWL